MDLNIYIPPKSIVGRIKKRRQGLGTVFRGNAKTKRAEEKNAIYHALKRGNAKPMIFPKDLPEKTCF
jgi:hypothetical protein